MNSSCCSIRKKDERTSNDPAGNTTNTDTQPGDDDNSHMLQEIDNIAARTANVAPKYSDYITGRTAELSNALAARTAKFVTQRDVNRLTHTFELIPTEGSASDNPESQAAAIGRFADISETIKGVYARANETATHELLAGQLRRALRNATGPPTTVQIVTLAGDGQVSLRPGPPTDGQSQIVLIDVNPVGSQ